MATTMDTTAQQQAWSGNERRSTVDTDHFDVSLQVVGKFIFRYGLALFFIWVGLLKFMPYEANNMEPMLMNSPILASAYQSLGLVNLSGMIGILQIVIGVLIAMRVFAPRLSAVGSFGAMVSFFITLSFMASTPGVWEPGYGFPALTALPGQFLVKDLVLLGVSIWTAGEALRAVRLRSMRSANNNYRA